MDIKLGGVNFEILQKALLQAKEAREHILAIMQEAKDNIVINHDMLPKSIGFHIDKDKIVDIIGQAGKTIKEIIEKFEVAIDLDRDKGHVKVQGGNKQKVEGAVEHIKNIVNSSKGSRKSNDSVNYKKGDILDGVVEKIIKVGALVKLQDGNIGMIHISKLADYRVQKVEDIVNEGDRVKVAFIEQKKDGKIALSLKEVV
jgi:polyribonucleotide nucleotidyltransferase